MAGTSEHTEVNTPVGFFPTILAKLEDMLNIVAAVTIFAVMLLTTAGIVSRILGAPIPAYLEISELAIAIFAFLGVAYAQRLGTHIRLDMIVKKVPGSLRWFIELLGSVVSLLLVLVLIRYSWDFFLNAYHIGDSTYDYEIPTWPAKLLVPFAFSVWALRILVEIFGYFELIISPNNRPRNVPLTLSPEEEARLEIEQSSTSTDGSRNQ
jgi:C4-dicarboxylate transporter DctQ subunit